MGQVAPSPNKKGSGCPNTKTEGIIMSHNGSGCPNAIMVIKGRDCPNPSLLNEFTGVGTILTFYLIKGRACPNSRNKKVVKQAKQSSRNVSMSSALRGQPVCQLMSMSWTNVVDGAPSSTSTSSGTDGGCGFTLLR